MFHVQKRFSSTFKDLGLRPPLCERLQDKFNITKPTPAQSRFIPALLQGNDVLLRDRTGTGKTFGTALTLASLVDANPQKSVRSLYVVPNQELAVQIGRWIHELVECQDQVKVFADREATPDSVLPHTVIGTPARLLELVSTNQLPSHALERLVLDEADQALSLPKRYATLKQQQRRQLHPKPSEMLLEYLNRDGHPQTFISSATLNRPLRHFLGQRGWVRDPVFIDLGYGSQVEDDGTVKHHCLLVSDDHIRNIQPNNKEQSKEEIDFDDLNDRMISSLSTLQEIESVKDGIVFVAPSVSVDQFKEKLGENDVLADDIRHYTPGQKKLWIATEFTARGVDIPGVSHVFILGKPSSVSSYLHMAGRTGRLTQNGFGSGKVISLVRNQGWTESKMNNMYQLLNIQVSPFDQVE
ncbi:P-loop containing nucleoside triphosphate hydrolase protein [Backusella circina FSU 941]|nr:P-loop containing nucleoside triphosphate hydrolase protein [Backusella circina FSU 941]